MLSSISLFLRPRRMTLHAALDRLDALASRLPFSLDDFEAVNALFEEAYEQQPDRMPEDVDLWTYCYIRRYYLHKFIRRTGHRSADLDALIEKAYRKVDRGRASIKTPGRYAHWVSVICKNTFLNFLRTPRQYVSLEDEAAPTLVYEPPPSTLDPQVARQAVAAAIERLPTYLQDVARLRLLRGAPYKEIARAVEKTLPVVRTYSHKALQRLREDDHLRAFTGPGE